MDAARRFLSSPEYRPLRTIRERAARTDLVLFEGVSAPSP
jgi:uncharacterized protein (DUF1330 family)